MSESAYNDDLLEKELFGGDSDDPDSMNMDVDGMLGMDEADGLGISSADQPDLSEDKDDIKQDTEEKEGSKSPQEPAQPQSDTKTTVTAAVAAPKPDIAMDDPPGELTMLERPARTNSVQAGRGLDKCSVYDIVPTIAFVNQYQIHATAATADLRWLYSGGEDGYIRKWDFFATVNGKQLLTQGQRHSLVDSVTKAGVMSSYWDHLDIATDTAGEALSPVYSLAAHSEGMWVASGMSSGHIALWSVRHDEGRRIALLNKHKQPVSVLRTTPDEFGLVSGSWDRAVLYWDLNTGRLARIFSGHTSQISSIEFQPLPAATGTSPLLMTSSIDGQCLLWDVRAPQDEQPQKFSPSLRTPPWATSACWSKDGRRVYVGRRNNTVDEYEVGMGNQPVRTLRLPMNSGPVTALAAMANGRTLICASTDNVRMWDLDPTASKRSAVPFQIIPGHHGGCISSVFVDASSRYMLTTSGNRGWDGSSNNVCLGYEIAPLAK
ncbi:Transcription factor spt8 [Coemansia sp. RSA 1722]|nr:Transcription factor spt8 [Coemansia sp. RSA 485]KAJ2599433.1 Transcription factor spt8 [Coemansia sp. RSA 1722]KAJ2601076.1 Transcription factor spt8 [Coemansia sp. RSA 1721]